MALASPPRLDAGSRSNVLYLAPALHGSAETGCGLLLSVGDAERAALLSVGTGRAPEAVLSTWREHVGDGPERAAFVLLGGSTRSAASVTSVDDAVADGAVSVHSVADPGNLTDVGIVTSSYLAEWDREGRSVVLCFRTLTTLLQYVRLETAFQFLHELTNRVRATDGVAHYHMDPSAHDERTVNTLVALFDAVAELDDDDDWRVRTRYRP